MSRQHHYLKILPKYFIEVEKGNKTFEVRFNDRNFKLYDILHLQEFSDGEYTGRNLTAEVTYILNDPNYVKEGYVIMSIKLI